MKKIKINKILTIKIYNKYTYEININQRIKPAQYKPETHNWLISEGV